ncbi:cysteine-tryptophan domain-containing zinc finger protein 7-like [Bidens hawaiensis]|uniref:cysteine-tryptophan domain-containing zinc finger protein 7-like n=1 Tax=Bidens hawaiensis TaxID=980011 RepID=UPI00404A07DD
MVNESEVEEGEASVDRNDAGVDPDTALAYIDEKLQHLLGHFQKDFEHEMSAEALGPKFGGYGSFLPVHRHPPPMLSHKMPLNPNKPSSPNNVHLEGAPVTLVDAVKPAVLHHKDVFVDQNVVSVDDMASKDTSKNEATTSKLIYPTGQRSLKVRIKVGSYTPAIKKDEIYSGLGLLTSSSTSNNSEDSSDSQIESHDLFDSAGSILRDMCSVFVPGNRLLSPLNESLICLKNKVKPLFTRRIVDGSSLSLDKNAGFEGDNTSYLEKGVETESVACKQGLTNDFKVKPSTGSVISEANRADKKDVPMKIKKTKNELINEQFFGPDFTSIESDKSYEQKNVKRHSLDSRRIKLVVCKNDSSVIKHETDHFEKKAGLKAISCEPHEVKVSNNMTKLPFERKSKLTGVGRKENLRDKKSALKEIAKVRNSYKDILGTDNGAIKMENVEGNAYPADLVVPQQTVVGPPAPPDNWVGCDRCEKWRLLPIGIEPANLPDKWLCSMTTWLPGRNHCDIGEEETTRAVQEMNIRFISQNQGSLQCNGSMGNTGISDHKNSNNKSRPLEGTSLSSMDGQQDYKQKSVIRTNQLLLAKKGHVKPKKLKSKTGSEQYEPVTSKKIKTESEQLNFSNRGSRPKDGLIISVKTETESTLLDKKVEIHAKKRKLKDWQESQPHGNILENSENRIIRKEKRLKTEVNESSDDRCLNKGKTMKIRLSASRENSVDRCKPTCKKDLESERFLVAATSSSSIVSGSCKRASLQEKKRSPVGPALSSPFRAPNLDKPSRKAHVRTEVPSQSQRIDGKVDLKHREASKIRKSHNLEHATEANGAIDKCERSNIQSVKVKASDPLTGQPNKPRRVEVDGKIVGKKQSEANLGDTGVSEMTPTVKKKIKKVSNELEPKVEAQSFERSDQNRSKIIKHPGVAANQTAKSIVTDSGTLKNLSVTSFLKEFASSQSQTALTAFKRAEESRDFADRLKVSGFDYECNNAYFDSSLKFLCAASLLEACNADISKSKGVDTINVYTTSAKLSKMCGQEYEKQKDMVASALAYKCMEIACMRIVYCKNLLTRQDLQTSMHMTTQGESPSSSASDVDNLNNQPISDKAILSKSMVVGNKANFSRLLDLTSDVNLAMEASTKVQNAYKSASAVLEVAQNKEMTFAVKRVVNFSFQDVKEFACLVQKAREAANRQENKRQYITFCHQFDLSIQNKQTNRTNKQTG